jgi:predicted nuclease of predicted toxin-antitoxin system
MKLLFDQNVSPRLATRLSDLFPQSAHVHPPGLGAASDAAIWSYARDNEFAIVSKDEDLSA